MFILFLFTRNVKKNAHHATLVYIESYTGIFINYFSLYDL
jgi:hypothetical protein